MKQIWQLCYISSCFKSDSKYLGFTKLADMAYQHEMESKANNVEFVNNSFDELMSEANRIIELIHLYLEK